MIFELFQDELPKWRWRIFWDGWDVLIESIKRFVWFGVPFLPCFCLDASTALSERPLCSVTRKCLSTSAVDREYASSMVYCGIVEGWFDLQAVSVTSASPSSSDRFTLFLSWSADAMSKNQLHGEDTAICMALMECSRLWGVCSRGKVL